MRQKKPHILLLINDEHRPDVLPIEGNLHIRTPTLDRFINEGVYFRNAYTPSPICVPARQSFLSGLYPRNCGSLNFGVRRLGAPKADVLKSRRRKNHWVLRHQCHSATQVFAFHFVQTHAIQSDPAAVHVIETQQ